MGDRVVLGEEEGLTHRHGLRELQRFDVQIAILLYVVFLHDAGGWLAGKNGADGTAFQVQVVLGAVASIQSVLQTVHVDGQWSHGKNGSFRDSLECRGRSADALKREQS